MSFGLHIVPITKSVAPLGRWGKLVLTGGASAKLLLTHNEDVEIPEAVAEHLTGGTRRLLNDGMGRLLILPSAGELIVAYDLAAGEVLYPPIEIRRDPDRGMSAGGIRFVVNLGVVFICETTLAFFREDCTLAWRVDGDFAGWGLEGTTIDQVHLVSGDWSGREERQIRSVVEGTLLTPRSQSHHRQAIRGTSKAP